MENTTELINLIHKIYREINKLEFEKNELERQLVFLNEYYEEIQKKEENKTQLEYIKNYHNKEKKSKNINNNFILNKKGSI